MFHKDWGNQHSEEASLETCRSVWAASDQGCKIPPGLWMSFCWGSCWWSQRGHWPGPRSCWGTPWSRYQQCPSPGHKAEIGKKILSCEKNTIGKMGLSNSFLNFFLSLFPDCIVPFCWEFRWSRPVVPRCRPRMSENVGWHQTRWQLARTQPHWPPWHRRRPHCEIPERTCSPSVFAQRQLQRGNWTSRTGNWNICTVTEI